jgi:hypothetical protein
LRGTKTVGPLASLLAELRIAPLRVAPGPDAAERVLLVHARHVHAEGGRIFVVGSADGRFAELAALGRVALLVWDGQPVVAKLAEVVHDIHRLARTTGAPVDDTAESDHPEPEAVPSGEEVSAVSAAVDLRRSTGPQFVGPLLSALATGLAIAAGQRMFDVLVPRRRR